METRLLVHGTDGWGGVTYKWRADGGEADLLENGGEETLTVNGHSFDYLYPSRQQCNPAAPAWRGRCWTSTRQLNRDFSYPGAGSANQIESLSVAGFIPQSLTAAQLTNVLTSAKADSVGLR